MKKFKDRVDAGKQLAQELIQFKNDPEAIVVGLPRGGVVTAYEVAKSLNLPLDIIVTRKIGAPTNPELAVGAITQDGEIVWNERVVQSMHLDKLDLAETIEKEKREVLRRLRTYRGERPLLDLKNKKVIIVDDGVATGATLRAAILWVKTQGARNIIAASPIGAIDALEKIKLLADECVCLLIPKSVWGISAYYDEFPQITDEEVIHYLSSLSA